MSKKSKILIFLLIITLLLFLYLVLTSESLGRGANTKINSRADEIKEKLSNDYKTAVSKIVNDYEQLAGETETAAGEGEHLKNQLLELKVPAEFKDLHFSLVLALIKLENYWQTGGEEEKSESERLVNQAKLNYDWLNK